MFDSNIPGDLQGPFGTPDFQKIMKFVVDEINAVSVKQKRGLFARDMPPRYRNFTQFDAFDILNDQDAFLRSCWAKVARQLTEQLYQYYFKRSADIDGMEMFSHRIAHEKSIISSIASMRDTLEHRLMHASDIEWAWRALKIVQWHGVSDLSAIEMLNFVGRTLNFGGLHRALISHSVSKIKKGPIVLMGAFDRFDLTSGQNKIHSIQGLISEAIGVDVEKIIACDISEDAIDCENQASAQVSIDRLLNSNVISNCGMLVVLGGCAKFERILPNHWIDGLILPVVVAGVSSGDLADPCCMRLIKSAVLVTSNDTYVKRTLQDDYIDVKICSNSFLDRDSFDWIGGMS